jgi:outer membrane protein insertion porin family
MKKGFKIWPLFIFIFLSFNSIGANVNSITFEGLTKTKESYLKGIISCKVGYEFMPERLENDVKTIRNLNLFFSVESSYLWNEDSLGWDLMFNIKEAIYLYPILYASGFKTQFKFEAGLNHINFRGHGESIGVIYKYYDRHSVSLFYNAMRHKNGKTGHDFSITKYSTVEPLYFTDTMSMFNYDNYNVSAGGHYWIKPRLRAGLGGMYMYETYQQLDTNAFDMGQFMFFFHKYQVKTFLDLNLVDYNYEFKDGIRNMAYLETIQTIDYPEISFFKFTNDFYFYKTIGERSTLALHNHLGIATNNPSPFAPFVLDGFLNIRGVGNRVSRGTAALIFNGEYRYSIWRHKWFIVQLAAFTDFGTLRQPGEKIVDMFNYREMKLFTGGGIRLHSRVLYKTSIRLDYSFNPLDPSQGGFTFGFGQFF